MFFAINKFKILSNLNEIQKISDYTLRQEKLLDLAQTLKLGIECKTLNSEDLFDESEIIKKLKKAHKDFVSNFFAAIGFILILLSGVFAILRSFN